MHCLCNTVHDTLQARLVTCWSIVLLAAKPKVWPAVLYCSLELQPLFLSLLETFQVKPVLGTLKSRSCFCHQRCYPMQIQNNNVV